MLRRFFTRQNVSDHEAIRLAKPAALSTILLCGCLILSGVQNTQSARQGLVPIILGVVGIVYALVLVYIIMPAPQYMRKWKWALTFINAVVVEVGLKLLPDYLGIIPHTILVLIAVIMAILWERRTTYIFLLIATLFDFAIIDWSPNGNLLLTLVTHFGPILLSLIVIETIQRLSETNRSHIQRLESLNTFARRISTSLESDELFSLIGAAIRNAITADTYFLGTTDDGDLLHLRLVFDDGQDYPPTDLPLAGTLSGWVLRNDRSLFIPDLRSDANLDGVQTVVVGKEKTSLCWMGVPMRSKHVNGLIAVASYRPNAFDRTDLDLLENLCQHAALAIDNAYHHAEVELQARLDSLTGVYNHGYIVKILNREAEQSRANGTSLCLIMLDVDYFKHYNDDYGHAVGDQVLILLTDCIRRYIHATDAVGRWGGEEFTIVLPNTTGPQALQVAERIRQTMSAISTQDRDGQPVPVPTVSQGIAVFPQDIDNVDRLIDIADQRLYIAKERGRNQVEPGSWPGKTV